MSKIFYSRAENRGNKRFSVTMTVKKKIRPFINVKNQNNNDNNTHSVIGLFLDDLFFFFFFFFLVINIKHFQKILYYFKNIFKGTLPTFQETWNCVFVSIH